MTDSLKDRPRSVTKSRVSGIKQDIVTADSSEQEFSRGISALAQHQRQQQELPHRELSHQEHLDGRKTTEIAAAAVSQASDMPELRIALPKVEKLTEEDMELDPEIKQLKSLQDERLAMHNIQRAANAINETEESKQVCDVCKSEFSNSIDFKNHRKSHIINPKRYECPQCGKKFSQSQNLAYHQTTIHNDLQLQLPSSQSEHDIDGRDLRDLRVFHCSEKDCTKTFPTYEQLFEHKTTVHALYPGKKPYKRVSREKIHQCSQCPRSFAKSSDLTRHLRIHTGERPFVCGECSASFTQKYRLTTHLRIHSGEKPFSCDYCNKSFARGDAVQSHVFLVHRDKRAKSEVSLYEEALEKARA